jgi:hypothetical protein
MERLIVSLDREEKRWLARRSREEGVSMAELIRRGVRKLREDERAAGPEPSFDELLAATSGIWVGGDGLAHQRRLRSEWPE